MEAYSFRYNAALILAAQAHQNQVRKGTDIPYITHVVHVSILLIRHGFDEDTVIAGLLHDVVEDTETSLATIETGFGPDVARIVKAVSEPKDPTDKAIPWEKRKQASLDHLREGGAQVAAVKAADTIHNAQALAEDLRRVGSSVWARFNRGPGSRLWYYRELAVSVHQWLGEHPIVAELDAALAQLAQLVDAESARAT